MIWNYDSCVSVLNKEIALLKKISLLQDSVRQAIAGREWTEFDSKMAQTEKMGEEFGHLEAERVKIFAALQKKYAISQPSFYSMVAKLPATESRELSKLYRELKMETFRVKALNESFFNYLKEVKTVAAAWLEAVAPDQKLYTRKGRQVSREPRSMILNHRM